MGLRIADREDGSADEGPGAAPAGDLETRELCRRVKQLEQENEILRHATAYLARDTLPE